MSSYASAVALADLIAKSAAVHAENLVARQLADAPELAARYGERQRRKAVDDATHTLSVLAEAIANDDPPTFARYVAWLDGILVRVGLPRSDLGNHLALLREHLLRALPEQYGEQVHAFLDPVIATMGPVAEASP